MTAARSVRPATAKKAPAKTPTAKTAAAKKSVNKPFTARQPATKPPAAQGAPTLPVSAPTVAAVAVPAKRAKPAQAARPPKPPKQPKTAKSPKVVSAAKTSKPAKLRQKPVRDSFTMPEGDFALIATLKARLLAAKRETKKSELLRAGLHALAGLDSAALVAALGELAPVKVGRPKSGG